MPIITHHHLNHYRPESHEFAPHELAQKHVSAIDKSGHHLRNHRDNQRKALRPMPLLAAVAMEDVHCLSLFTSAQGLLVSQLSDSFCDLKHCSPRGLLTCSIPHQRHGEYHTNQEEALLNGSRGVSGFFATGIV
jgi:hypothetical protein